MHTTYLFRKLLQSNFKVLLWFGFFECLQRFQQHFYYKLLTIWHLHAVINGVVILVIFNVFFLLRHTVKPFLPNPNPPWRVMRRSHPRVKYYGNHASRPSLTGESPQAFQCTIEESLGTMVGSGRRRSSQIQNCTQDIYMYFDFCALNWNLYNTHSLKHHLRSNLHDGRSMIITTVVNFSLSLVFQISTAVPPSYEQAREYCIGKKQRN